MIQRCRFKVVKTFHFLSTFGGSNMPKSKSQNVKNEKSEQKSVDTAICGPVTVNKNGNITIRILAKPGAKANNITGVDLEAVGVQISAPAVEGEANAELVRYLASVLGLRKTDVTLDKGSKSRQKTVILHSKLLSVSEVTEKLKSVI